MAMDNNVSVTGNATRAGRKRRGVQPHVQDAMEITRFWRLVASPTTSGCRDWLGDTDERPDGEGGTRGGYGVYVWRGERFPAHELAVTFTTGEVRDENLDTCHSCDRPICCAPEHLRFDTRMSNVEDMIGRGRGSWQQEPDQDFVDMIVTIRTRRANGASLGVLAEQYGFSKPWVSMTCRGKRWSNLPGPIVSASGTGPKNEHGTKRPDDEYIEAVRLRRAAGETREEIAETIDHSADWVGRVCTGLFYGDAPGPTTGRRTPPQEVGAA